jgi:4-phospho-D-threonate 3-dehydrogenase / 4-phospho-D-erythronate 3-dehydrogenase
MSRKGAVVSNKGPVRLGLTVGDPAGIGPEIVLKALASPERPDARYIVYGPLLAVEERARCLGLRPPSECQADWVDVPLAEEIALGRCSAAAGHAAAHAVLRAVEDVESGRIEAIVTAPLHKRSLHMAGYPWPGHTEMLAAAAHSPDVAMMFVGGGLRVALVTIHRSLRSVPDAVTAGEVQRVVRLVHADLPRFGAKSRSIALCGLNPHAGEGGLFGSEEATVLSPAIEALRAGGIDVQGPFPADTVFVRAVKGQFDAVVALYHDQGLIPVKLAAFGHAVNVTIGLPFVRTSVDHGTGFDIVEQGVADEGSLLEALKLASQIARWRD